MDFLKKLFSDNPTKPQKRYHTFSVKCLRCGEIIEGRIDLDNELSVEYESNRDVYYGRKVLMGAGRCFQRIEVEMKFSFKRDLLDQQVSGGEFI